MHPFSVDCSTFTDNEKKRKKQQHFCRCLRIILRAGCSGAFHQSEIAQEAIRDRRPQGLRGEKPEALGRSFVNAELLAGDASFPMFAALVIAKTPAGFFYRRT
jgi:hypothetical protein